MVLMFIITFQREGLSISVSWSYQRLGENQRYIYTEESTIDIVFVTERTSLRRYKHFEGLKIVLINSFT